MARPRGGGPGSRRELAEQAAVVGSEAPQPRKPCRLATSVTGEHARHSSARAGGVEPQTAQKGQRTQVQLVAKGVSQGPLADLRHAAQVSDRYRETSALRRYSKAG